MRRAFSLHSSIAQGSLEYLLIIGGAILISTIVIFLAINSTTPVSSSAKTDVLNSLCAKFSQSECGQPGFDPDFDGACLPKDCEWKIDSSVCTAVDLGERTDNCFKESGSSGPGVPETCHDFILNGDEVSVDCGGSCVACEVCPNSWSGTKCCDDDSDTYGRYLSDLRDCDFALNIPDCDDSKAEINPGMPEICNNLIDDDCNLKVDCEDPACFANEICKGYAECNDSDKDGFGKPGTNIQTCSNSTTVFDCDDSKAEVNPDASEVCGSANTVDYDCDGLAGCLDSDCSSSSECLCFNDRHDGGEERVDCGGNCSALCIPLAPRTMQYLHYERTPNLVADLNPNISGTAYWNLTGAQLDTVSHTEDGSGSFKFTPEGTKQVVFMPGSGKVKLTPGKPYTVSFFMKTDSDFSADPAPLSVPFFRVTIGVKKTDETYYTAYDGYYSVTYSNQWEENVFFYTPLPEDSELHYFSVSRGVNYNYFPQQDNLWLDDLYFGEGHSFAQDPPSKDVFSSPSVRMDALGNIDIFRNNSWEPFFPFCMEPSDYSTQLQYYSNLGINCIRGWDLGDPTGPPDESPPIQYYFANAKNSVSSFNPNGLMVIPLLSIYTEDPNFTSYFGRVDRLRNSLTDLVNSQDKDVLLGYDWEVEGEGMASYRLAKSVLTTVKEFDNQHPIYTFGIISKKAPIAFTDAIGTYVSGKWGNTAMELDRLVVLDNLDGVTKPVGFGVFSKGEPRGNSAAGFRAQLYKSIIVGVKGMFYYRDPISSSVTSVLPVLRTELDALLPLIREPHWTSWSASSSDSGIFFGTRDNGKEAFIIALNDTAAPVTTTFTISGLYTYTPVSVKNFFAGAEIVPFADSKFTVTIPANSTAVYRLKRSVS